MQVKILAGLLLVASVAVSGAVQATTISLSPATQTAGVGGPVTVDLNITGLDSSTALSSFDISVNFDSALLSYQSTTFGDPALGDQLDLGNLGLNGPVATPGTGTVDLIETDIFDSPSTLLSGQAKSFTLGVLTFYGLIAGATPVSVTINSLADQDGSPFVANTAIGSVTVQPVPLPAPIWLLASGFAALALLASVGALSGSGKIKGCTMGRAVA